MFEKESTYEHEHDHDHDNQYEDDDDEDTLSFYELSVNSSTDAWEDSSKESSFKSSEQEQEDKYFEFFSAELKKNDTEPENIIFCGKIIPHKQPIIFEDFPKSIDVKDKKHRKRSLFKWKSIFTSSFKSTTFSRNDEPKDPCTNDERKRSKMHGFSVNKMSILTSMTKSRWYVYLFGITRFPSEMELRDMKNRQTRGSPSSSLPRLENSEYYTEYNSAAWRLLRVLSCSGSHQADAVVEAAVIGRYPRV